MTIKYYADPEHTRSSSYRNAGTYYTVASLHPEDEDYINSNYIIYDTERICVIGVLQRNVYDGNIRLPIPIKITL